MTEDRRKDLRDVLDELDKYFEEFEKDIQETVRGGLGRSHPSANPFVAGFSFAFGPEGKPSIQFFGDTPSQEDGQRYPMTEQILDEKNGRLRLVMEMPGVDKDHIQVEARDDSIVVTGEKDARKYRAEVELKADVDPESGSAEYNNGILEISFSLKDKANKGFKRVNIV